MSESKQLLYEAYDYSRNPTWRRIFIFLAYLPLSYIGISALYLYVQWDKIPDQKSFGEVYSLLIVCLVLVAPMTLLFFFTLNHPFKPVDSLDDSPVDRAREKLKAIVFVLGIVHWIALVMCYGSIARALSPHLMLKASDRYLGMILTAVLPSLFFVPLYFWLRPKQSLYAEESADKDDRAQDFSKHWKFGAFYWNPDNPSCIVPRRFGTGYTLNLATRRAWVYIGFIFFPLIFLLTAAVFLNVLLNSR